MEIPLINNGKMPDEILNCKNAFWLPTDAPYGNFTLKLFKIITRIDELNRRISEVFHSWAKIKDGLPAINPVDYDKHEFGIEQSVYLMRKTADELIALYYVLLQYELMGKYPDSIELDCMGKSLKRDDLFVRFPFLGHKVLFETLNEVSNAYKHSFVNSDINSIGQDEPLVLVLSLKYNKLESGIRFHNLSFKVLVEKFNIFYLDMFQWVKKFSKKHKGNNSIISH